MILRSTGGSGHNGGVGRNTLLPHTTKRRLTTNLKTNKTARKTFAWKSNNQGVKETLIQTVRGVENDSWVERMSTKAAAGRLHGRSHIHE